MRILALAVVLVGLTASEALAGALPPVPVPEPATLTLLALSMGGVALAKFRHRK